jgi:hypothetical protein
MSTEGWVFMIGFRVLDVGLLVVWLVWFFRLRDDDDSDGGGGPGGGGPEPEPSGGPGGGGLALPLGRVRAGGHRIRDHVKPHRSRHRRGAEPLPAPSPPRIRRPATPSPVHRRSLMRNA